MSGPKKGRVTGDLPYSGAFVESLSQRIEIPAPPLFFPPINAIPLIPVAEHVETNKIVRAPPLPSIRGGGCLVHLSFYYDYSFLPDFRLGFRRSNA